MSKLPIYVGLFLVNKSRDLLSNLIEVSKGIELYDRVYLDHVTLKYKPREVDMDHYGPIIGRRYRIKVDRLVYDEKAQVIPVDRLDLGNLVSDNQVPHITVACSNGVQPVYSNELILSGKFKTIELGNVEVEMILDEFPRKFKV